MEKHLMKLPYCCGQSFKRGLWSQRNYRCSFCKKGFKSAQALGGHMNVHRRDRARLRLLSPSSPYQNPNPSFSLKPTSLMTFNNMAPFSGGVAGNSSDAVAGESVKRVSEESNRRGKKKVSRVWKATEFVGLDLNLGLIPDVEEEDHLDLELRLGYSN